MTGPNPRGALSRRVVGIVLAVAVVAGVLLSVVVHWLGQADTSGAVGSPRLEATPRLHSLMQVVDGHRVTSIAAGNDSVVYGTEAGGIFATSGHAALRRITGMAGQVVKLAFDPTGRWLAAADDRSELAVVDTATGAGTDNPAFPVIRRHYQSDAQTDVGVLIKPVRLAVDRTGSRVVVQTDLIGVYNMHDNRPPYRLVVTDACLAEYTANGISFVGTKIVATFDSCASVWNASTLRLEREIYFPGTGPSLPGHQRIIYGTFRHVMLLEYRKTRPLPSASAVPGQSPPRLGGIIADKTIGTRRAPIYPVADDGRVVAVLQDTRLTFWEPATHRILTSLSLPFPAVCPAQMKVKGPAEFTTSFSPDHKTLVITGYCPPAQNASGEDQSHALYRRWMLAYPS
ncbi:hypothetical protein [Streptomyces sp. NPDC001833]|uniref:hypothetical protein n=1 Tax=Streptomyces sp. NPDC001833 TaxID=3154658 RepID=UPI003332064C